MSGGSFDYLYEKVSNWHIDRDLAVMLQTIFKSVEWSESCDISRQDAEKEIYERVLKYMNELINR